MTRSDVAVAAGVSVTTVTHALNPRPGTRMSAATRERVCRVARELGYRPNFVGRALVSGRTFTIGLLHPRREAIFSQFYQQMTFGMAEPMESEDYHLLILFRSPDHRFLRVITQGRVDGMFVLQSDLENSHIDRIVATGMPLVVVNKRYIGPPGSAVVCVHSDHAGLMRDVVCEFVGCGCRTLLALHDYRFCDANAQMLDAFVSAVSGYAERGVVASTLIPDQAHLQVQLRNLFRSGQRWDGMFVDGATLADHLVQAGLAEGCTPGRDYQLIVAETQPGRTTASRTERAVYCHQPELVGRTAWDALQRLLQGGAGPRQVVVPYSRSAVAAVSAAPGDTRCRADDVPNPA